MLGKYEAQHADCSCTGLHRTVKAEAERRAIAMQRYLVVVLTAIALSGGDIDGQASLVGMATHVNGVLVKLGEQRAKLGAQLCHGFNDGAVMKLLASEALQRLFVVVAAKPGLG
jgi:hypothetical protein